MEKKKKPAVKKTAKSVKPAKKPSSSKNVIHMKINKKDVYILGTAHVLAESKKEVQELIAKVKPDTVCVELCDSRYQSLKNKDRWRNLNIVKVIREGNGFLLFANMILGAFQKRIGVDLESAPGDEMITAFQIAEQQKMNVVLADRDVNVTLKRAWGLSSFKDKMSILELLIETMFEKDKIEKEDINDLMKGKDMFNEVMQMFAQKLPKVKEVFIDERDRFIANKILTAPGKKIVAVVGKGHLSGIEKDIKKKFVYDAKIATLPKPSILPKLIPWFIFGLIIVIIVIGFFKSPAVGLNMLWAWVAASGTATALFAAAALAHPLTILASYVAAPIKLIVPTISAGMLLAPLEAVLRKPQVKDFETLNNDMLTFTGFYKNRILKILVVFIGVTIGAIIGHTIAIIWIAQLLAK